MEIDRVKNILKERGEPKYRWRQFCEAVGGGVREWPDFTVFSKGLRGRFEEEGVRLREGGVEKVCESEDGARKILMDFGSGEGVEVVLLPNGKGGWRVCLSSQVGCGLGCRFCKTGEGGLKRNLRVGEFVEQFIFWKDWLRENGADEVKLGGGVVMGMGEPMNNYEVVVGGLDFLSEVYGISLRQWSISTAGVVPGIVRMTDDERARGINLAVSLHTPDQKQREELMPGVARRWSLDELVGVMKDFARKRAQKVFVEYVMMEGVNDGISQAKRLVDLLGEREMFHINLIRYNEAGGEYRPTSEERVRDFAEVIRRKGFDVTRRRSLGAEIGGACGQLAGKEGGSGVKKKG